MQLTLNNQIYYCATTLRVVYSLKESKGLKSFQEALNTLSKLDSDEQLDLLYTAYKCDKRNGECLDKDTFIDLILDECGVFKLTNIVEELIDGLLYSGLSQEETQEKKAKIQETLDGMNSSNMLAD